MFWEDIGKIIYGILIGLSLVYVYTTVLNKDLNREMCISYYDTINVFVTFFIVFILTSHYNNFIVKVAVCYLTCKSVQLIVQYENYC